jgi:hypothetical protein
MYDQIQTALTIAIEVIALIGFIGLPIHAIVNHHINTVRSWGTPQSMPAVDPVVEEVEPVSIATVAPVTKLVIESVIEPIQGVLELIYEPVVEEAASDVSVKQEFQSVGAAAIDVQKMTARELREYCKANKVKGYSKILKEQGTEGLRAFIGKGLK